MKKIFLFLNIFEFVNNRELFGEKVIKNKFIIGNFIGKGFWYFLYVCFVMGVFVYRNVLNVRWFVYVYGNLWKMIVGVKDERNF